jgi:hypothetical protein
VLKRCDLFMVDRFDGEFGSLEGCGDHLPWWMKRRTLNSRYDRGLFFFCPVVVGLDGDVVLLGDLLHTEFVGVFCSLFVTPGIMGLDGDGIVP